MVKLCLLFTIYWSFGSIMILYFLLNTRPWVVRRQYNTFTQNHFRYLHLPQNTSKSKKRGNSRLISEYNYYFGIE